MESRTDRLEAESEWEQRRLCPDESCIGTIGPDGRCRECGRQAGENRSGAPEVQAAEPPPATMAAAVEAPAGQGEDRERQPDTEWDARRLCEDESCIGTIGPDGCCRECGRRART